MPDEKATPAAAPATAPKPALTPAQRQQEIAKRINTIRSNSHTRIRSVLSDIGAKCDAANDLLGKSANSHDDAFDVTADMLLEQAVKQLNDAEAGIQAFRVELAKIRKFDDA